MFPIILHFQLEHVKLIDLNEDCLYLIFNRLGLGDLVNIAEVSSKFAHIGSSIFRQTYSKYKIRLIKSSYSGTPYAIGNTTIKVSDFNLIPNLMKYFGKHIRKMIIPDSYADDFSGDCWSKIHRFVNEYGSKSLTELKLGRVYKELWPMYTVPFQKVENLDIELQTDPDGMKLNELCPNLRRLKIHSSNSVNTNFAFIDCELPYLEFLTIDVGNWWSRGKQLLGILEKNPQIRSIYAKDTSSQFKKKISEYFPRLDYLVFYLGDSSGDPLHFESVKHFDLYLNSGYTSLQNLSFSHLESLEFTHTPKSYDIFVEFFQRHRNLSRLHLRESWGGELDLEALTVDLPKLVEMIIDHDFDLSIENMTRFIERHPKLTKFQFKVREEDEGYLEILRNRFGRDWHIEKVFNERAFVFKKMQL